MGWFQQLFGGKSKQDDERPGKRADEAGRGAPNKQLPSHLVAQEFGEVNVRRVGSDLEVLFTILMEPTGVEAEGWQTGVAIDGSGSMQGAFGKEIEVGPRGGMSEEMFREYVRRGWIQIFDYQGQKIPILNQACKAELVERGHAAWTKNDVEPLARRMTAYLASNLDADGGTTVIYWACGGDGKGLEVIGDLTAEDCERSPFPGPSQFGNATHLTPAVKYFAERFADAKNGMYLFITDGEINDLPEVKRETIKLCREIQAKKRNPLKCVLIGVGDQVNEAQMEELDDLESGTDVDLWDHKIAREMRALVEIFAEVVGEHKIVAPTGRIYAEDGSEVKTYADGLPGRVSFRMPASSGWFELEVAGQRIRQTVVIPS